MKRSDFDHLIANGVHVYGDIDFRGKCATENVVQSSFVAWLRREWPDDIGALVVHIENEGKLIGGQFHQLRKRQSAGMTKGASDIIIPGSPAFVCELKRADYTKSKWQDGQIDYLVAAARAGAFSCVAMGHDGATKAVLEWLEY